MSQQVDSQTVNLNDGESASITLSWDTTNPDDIGDYIATAATEDDADTTSVTVENVTYHRFVEAVSPGGAASASRAGASDRSAVAAGTGAATVTRAVTAGRSLAATSRRGAGSASRTSVTGRATTAVIPGGSGSIVRTVTVSSRRVSAAGTGAATVTRAVTAGRSLAVTSRRGAGSASRASVTGRATTAVIPGGSGSIVRTVTVSSRRISAAGSGVASITRSTDYGRNIDASSLGGDAWVVRSSRADRLITATGRGRGVIVWSAPTAWQLPTDTASGSRILVNPISIETDHDQLALSAQVSSGKLAFFDHYRRAGDVVREDTAYGAFRRVRRDGDNLITARPPTSMSPPFDDRQVAPLDFTSEEIAPGRHEIDIVLGLEKPRGREPLQRDISPTLVDSSTINLDAGQTSSVTLSWTPAGSDIGDWLATVSSRDDSDEELVAVSDGPWTLAFPVATLGLTDRQIGQLEQSHVSAVPSVSIPLRLNAQQTNVLLAAGSRVEATRVRSVPDGGNVVVDTLPDEELTCVLDTPSPELEDGEYILAGWGVTRERTPPNPYDATIQLLRSD